MKVFIFKTLYFGLSVFAALGALSAFAAGRSASPAVESGPFDHADAPLFTEHKVLDLALTVDFDALCRPNEDQNCEYTPTAMQYRAAKGVVSSIRVEIRVRGGWRARKDHCEVPPLFVRFSAEDTRDTPFAGQKLLPLNTHCRSERKRTLDRASPEQYEQYVLKEYLGYRLYNLFTEKSLRVRLARIDYSDSLKSRHSAPHFAFFTEHFDDMAARNNTVRLESDGFDYEKIDLASLDQVALFNFMIGNTDWSVVRERNIVLIADASGRQYPVPFDLDMSGLVDAEYGGVSPRLNFRDPRQRYYLGFCHPEVDFQSLFARFQARRADVLKVAKNIPGMDWETRKWSRVYLTAFFDVLESTEQRQEQIIDGCHPWPPSPVDHTSPPDVE